MSPAPVDQSLLQAFVEMFQIPSMASAQWDGLALFLPKDLCLSTNMDLAVGALADMALSPMIERIEGGLLTQFEQTELKAQLLFFVLLVERM